MSCRTGADSGLSQSRAIVCIICYTIIPLDVDMCDSGADAPVYDMAAPYQAGTPIPLPAYDVATVTSNTGEQLVGHPSHDRIYQVPLDNGNGAANSGPVYEVASAATKMGKQVVSYSDDDRIYFVPVDSSKRAANSTHV